MEHAFATENTRILGIQAEHQPDAQLVQAFQRFRVLWVLVLLQKRVIEHPHQLARLEGDLHFLFYVLAARVHQELQTVGLLGQVLQPHDFRLIIGAVHVVYLELLEVAHDDPAGILVVRQIPGVAPGLLVGRQHAAVRLLVPFP